MAGSILAEPNISAELYGGFHLITVEDTDTDHNKSEMDYKATISLEDKKEIDKETNLFWYVEAQLEGPDGGNDVEVKEVYAGLESGIISGFVGRISVGGDDGVIKGHKYMTETGMEYTGTYGNSDGGQPSVAFRVKPLEVISITLGYSTRSEDISVESSDDEGNVSVLDFVAEADLKVLKVGLEYESKSFEDNDQNVNDSTNEDNEVKEAEVKIGFGISLALMDNMITPFINIGQTTETTGTEGEKISTTERNIGVDILLTRSMGATIGLEMLSRDGSSAQIYYLGMMKHIGENISIGGSYWSSSQKEEDGFDNLKSCLDIELAVKF